MVRLEQFYYATLPGDVSVLSSEFKADMAFKCHLCKKVYMNNVEFARHLSLHLESDRAAAVDLVDLCQCKYCFKVSPHGHIARSNRDGINSVSNCICFVARQQSVPPCSMYHTYSTD